MLSPDLISEVSTKLAGNIDNIEPLDGGGNNQVYSIVVNGKKYVVKSYFDNGNKINKKGKNEFSFSTLLWNKGEKSTPKPILQDDNAKWSVYEKLNGKSILDPSLIHVLDSARFIGRIKNFHNEYLNPASEACLLNKDYFDILRFRLNQLAKITPTSDVAVEAHSFVVDTLLPKLADLEHQEVIPESSFKILSPSDFGYHNALLQADGKLRYFDFEHAGVDDPAKMVCDFFSQPKVKVPLEYLKDFILTAFSEQEAKEIFARIKFIFPLVRLKWCCILLNEFSKEGLERRSFALENSDDNTVCEEQLRKSKAMFASLEEILGGKLNAMSVM
ncbi:aminoglycoside phosphotransferase family protein [Paraglaciecola sp.]|uniref:aminoglycoside phosphotransferase family protein n=1 Tax=Paraglaciecola sp. TaxID=1920173 RepID=UPI003EF8C04E